MRSSLTLLSVIVVSAATMPAQAAGTPEQRRACRADAFRLCRSAIPNVARITACMERNVALLTPACRAQFR